MSLQYTIKGKLPTLNEYTNSNRTHWGAGATLKKNATRAAALACADISIPDDKKIILHCNWYTSTKHDRDNLGFGIKFINDGLVEAGKIHDDSPKHVIGFTHDFTVVPKGEDRVVIDIELVS